MDQRIQNLCKVQKHFFHCDICLRNTDQSKIKALFSHFTMEHLLREKKKIAEKNENRLFRKGFSAQKFMEKLRVSSPRKKSCGETLRDFVKKLCEILRWVGKDRRFLYADSEDSDQMEKLSKCPSDMSSLHLRGHKTNSKSLRPQYNHRLCSHRGGTMYIGIPIMCYGRAACPCALNVRPGALKCPFGHPPLKKIWLIQTLSSVY